MDGFGGGDFETAGAFHHDEGDLVFFKAFDSMGDTFWLVGFGFGFRQRRNGDDEVSFGDIDACVIVSGTHHKPALHSVVLSGNCPVVSMGARPLPELRDGCLPRVCTGGGRAVCCYDTEVPIYKGVCLWRARRCPLCQVACYSNRVRALSTHPTNLAIERLPENCFSPVGTTRGHAV